MKRAQRFTGTENHSVTMAEAVSLIKNYRTHYGTDSRPACFFDKQVLRAVLDQPHAVGLRYYFGFGHDEQPRLILVGTNAQADDLVHGEHLYVSMSRPPLTVNGVYDRTAVQHAITLEEASELTGRYQQQMQTGHPKGGFFSAGGVRHLLDQPGCTGLNFFFGANAEGARTIVLLGVDAFGTGMFYGLFGDLTIWCPPICGVENALNRGASSRRRVRTSLEIA